jgi:hypothetical protein
VYVDPTFLFFFAFVPLRARKNERQRPTVKKGRGRPGKKSNASPHQAYAPLAFYYGLEFLGGAAQASPPKRMISQSSLLN